MFNFSVIFLILGIFIIIITSLFLVFFNTGKEPTDGKTPGNSCNQTSDCFTGLMCKENICVIPKHGACVSYSEYCITGSKCVDGECQGILTEACIKKEIINKIIDKITKKYTKIYISRNLNGHFEQLPINLEFVSIFFYNGIIFVVDDSNKIMSYDINGNFIKQYQNNIEINNNMEVYYGNVYTLIDDKLWISKIPKIQSDEFNFTLIETGISEIKSNDTMTTLFKNYKQKSENYEIIPGVGNEKLYIDKQNKTITHTNQDGSEKLYNYTFYKNIVLSEGTIYFTENETKSYIKDTYKIFLNFN
jgi:hypothetical protein